MTDRELLEMAAKAAGLNYGWIPTGDENGSCLIRLDDGVVIGWNPLTDDGDALRLAVALRLNVDLTDCECCVHVYANQLPAADEPDVSERHTDCATDSEIMDAYAATRRAITRAAAEIGKAMP